MKLEEKLEQLGKLKESELRRQVLAPLLGALGFADVHEFHGPREKGKDLIFREASRLGEVFVHAAVVSTHDITGTVGDTKSAERILDQVRQVIEEPYVDMYTGRQSSIDRCWVITSRRILPSAIESIAGHLHRSHLDKLVRFVDGSKLVALLDQAYPQYWERPAEIAYYSPHEQIDISSNSLDSPFDRKVEDLPAAGSLTNSVYAIKKAVYSLMLTIDFDLSRKLASILRSTHPWEIITLWEILDGEYFSRDGTVYVGRMKEEIGSHWEYLLDDTREYEERFDITPESRNLPKTEPWER